jgi:hypothetical protein
MIVNASGRKYVVPLFYITEGNPTVQVNRTLNMTYTNFNSMLKISNSGDGILLWDILQTPDWLTVDMQQFNPMVSFLGKEGSFVIPFSFNRLADSQNSLNGTIILKTNDQNNPIVQIAVSFNRGNPVLSSFDTVMDFGSRDSLKTTRISNYGSGYLNWRYEGLPDWLSVATPIGTLWSYSSSNDITFACHRANLQPGIHMATFYLKTNDPAHASVAITATVRVAGTSANIKALEGNIMDAAFDKRTNLLYYVTGQPNKLVAYDVTARTVVHEAPLAKAPTCLAIDENFKQALVGHGGAISTVDLTSFLVTKTYELNTTVYDVEWVNDGWFCYTIADSYTSNLLWINSGTGETYQTPQTPMNYSLGTADLKKVPNQPYLIASRKNLSPSGIFVFDLATKALKSYTHADFNNLCFFKQGEFMIAGKSSIFRTSAVTQVSGNQAGNPSSIGQLKGGNYPNIAWWTDYCEASHSIWTVFSYYPVTYYQPEKGAIYQFEDNDYTLVKTYAYDYMYQPTAQTTAYEVEARYIFSNSAGTELSVLRKGASNTTWTIEFIAVQ